MPDPVTVALYVPNILLGASINPLIGKKIEDLRRRRQLKKEVAAKVERFQGKMKIIKGYLQDADNKQRQNPDVREWLQQLKEIVYDAEDIFDGYATDLALHERKFDPKTKNDTHAGSTTTSKVKRIIEKPLILTSKGKEIIEKASQKLHFNNDPNKPAKTSKHQVAKNIETTNRKLDDHLELGKQLGLLTPRDSSAVAMRSRQSSSCIKPFESTSIESREAIKNDIVKTLLQDLNKEGANQPTLPTYNNERTHIQIIRITGMGGIGKTTLAKKIFNDDKVQSYFKPMMVWVCVPYNFEATNLINLIIESIYQIQEREPRFESQTLQISQNELRRLIEGKKFLLILDDVWTIGNDQWSDFISLFHDVNELYCCIIITTRNSDIKTMINKGSIHAFPLHGLEFNEAWKLFHETAFGEKSKDSCYSQLESIGERLLLKLKGSPLAIKTVGSLLKDDLQVDHWLRVLESELLKPSDKESDIYSILMLSYQHLPSEYKDCLLIFSLFPKGYVFTEDNLILLWLAYGIIGGEEEKPEDQGREYFQYLVDRSFLDVQGNHFRNSKYSMHDNMDGSFMDDFGNIFSIHDSTIVRPLLDVHGNEYQDKMCTMHDLIHDMVQSIFRLDCHFPSEDNEHGYILKNLRHTSIYHVGEKTILCVDGDTGDSKELVPYMLDDPPKKRDYEKPRTLLLTGNILMDGNSFESLVSKMIHLRVLRLVGLTIERIPESIGKLKHLRYLVVKTSATMLPESIGYLYNLQVLGIFKSGIRDFPEKFTRLVNLRYILGDVQNHCVNIKGIGNLRMLRMLPRFRISENTGFDISELENLNELHGNLCIENLGHVKGKEAAERAWLDGKKNLKKLSFSWGINTVDRSSKVDEEVFEALKPWKYIREIVVDGYQGMNLPSWMNNSDLSMLDFLKLKDCSSLRDLPLNFREMRSLRCLHLCHLRSLSEIRWEMCPSGLFPALEELKLEDLPELGNCIVSGDDKEKRSTKRVSLTVRNCRKLELVVLPMLMSFNGVQGCHMLHKWHVYSTMVSIEKMCIKGTPKLTCWYLPLPPADLDFLTIQGNGDMVDIRFGRRTGGCSWNISVPGVVAVKPLYEEKPEGSGFCSSDACSIIVSHCQDNAAGYATASAASHAVDPSLYFCNRLTSLKKVYIIRCVSLVTCTLPTTMASLRELLIDECMEMASLDLPETMTSLRRLSVYRCPSLKTCRLPPIPADYKSLQVPGVNATRRSVQFAFKNLPGYDVWVIDPNPELLFYGIAGHSSPTGIKADELVSHFRDVTKSLAIEGRSLQHVTQLITEDGAGHLESLSIEECSDLEFVHLEPILLGLTSLTTLHLSNCRQLKSLTPDVSGRLVCLREIELVDLPLQSPLDLRHLKRLEKFRLRGCEELATLMLPPVIFEELNFWHSGALTSVWFPPATDSLDINRCPHLVINLGAPSSGEVAVSATDEGKADRLSLLQVTDFQIHGCHQQQLAQLLERIDPAHLERLRLTYCEDLKEMSTLRRFTSLTWLEMLNCTQLESLPAYICCQRFPLLEFLWLCDCPLLSSLPDMQHLSSLRELWITHCPKLNDWYGRQPKGNDSLKFIA